MLSYYMLQDMPKKNLQNLEFVERLTSGPINQN